MSPPGPDDGWRGAAPGGIGTPERRAATQQLALAASHGDAAALDSLLELVVTEGTARRAIDRLLYDPADRADVHQDTLIEICRSIRSFRGDAHVDTWIHTIARRAAIGFLRRRRDNAETHPHEPPSASRRLSSMVATREDVRAAVGELPERYRGAVSLRDLDDLPYEEIARRLDLNLNTTRARIARGRALLATTIAESIEIA